jgi:hypothetical protein
VRRGRPKGAITDSIQRNGNDTTPNAASDSVIECAIVKRRHDLCDIDERGAKRLRG